MIKDKVKDTIIKNELIKDGEHIVIGLSGGPDSVCLFHILHSLKEEWNLGMDAVHINHGLRPGAADEDQQYAEELCRTFGVPCHSYRFDVKKLAEETGMSSEDAGRQVRYRAFSEIAQKIAAETGKVVKIAVAQNMNDQAETVLMRILRGTGTDGLCGIEYLRKDAERGVIIRPLLDITRQEIEAYCRDKELSPRIDLTNLEPLYTRNKIRLELLPYLRDQFNSNITAALCRLSDIAKEDRAYFTKKVGELIDQHAEWGEGVVRMPLSILNDLEPALRSRTIKGLFEGIGLIRDMSSVHLEQAEELLKEGRTSSSVDFPLGFGLRIQYGFAEFYKKTEEERISFEYEVDRNREGKIEIRELNAELGVKILRRQDWESWKKSNNVYRKNEVCSLSLDQLLLNPGKLVLRTRRPGDYIIPLGMKGRKKMQDFFVDAKIGKEERDRKPIVCIGSEVIWITGSRINEKYKVGETTERIIVLEYFQ